jgi:hypothetical protein
MQYFIPKPSRLFVPIGGCFDLQRLRTDRLLGCIS